MATRVTEFETHVGEDQHIYFTFSRRYCSDCGNDIKSIFSCKCERCGEVFDSQLVDYVPERNESERVEF